MTYNFFIMVHWDHLVLCLEWYCLVIILDGTFLVLYLEWYCLFVDVVVVIILNKIVIITINRDNLVLSLDGWDPYFCIW